MELVDFSGIFRGFGGFFLELIDFSLIFNGIGGFFLELVYFSWIFRGIGGNVEKTQKMCRRRILIEGAFLSPFGFETIVNSSICMQTMSF